MTNIALSGIAAEDHMLVVVPRDSPSITCEAIVGILREDDQMGQEVVMVVGRAALANSLCSGIAELTQGESGTQVGVSLAHAFGR